MRAGAFSIQLKVSGHEPGCQHSHQTLSEG